MLVLTRRAGESVVIANAITVTVLAVEGGRARLGFAAPSNVAIWREELSSEVGPTAVDAGPENDGGSQAGPSGAPPIRKSP